MNTNLVDPRLVGRVVELSWVICGGGGASDGSAQQDVAICARGGALASGNRPLRYSDGVKSASYRVAVTSDACGGWTVQTLGRTARAQRIRDIVPVATAVVAAVENIDPDSVTVDIDWPAELAASLDEVARHAEAAREANARIGEIRRELIAAMRARGEKYEDIAVLLGVSRQRAQAIAEDRQ